MTGGCVVKEQDGKDGGLVGNVELVKEEFFAANDGRKICSADDDESALTESVYSMKAEGDKETGKKTGKGKRNVVWL